MAENTEREIFVRAHQIGDHAEREAYLVEACGARPELLNRIRQLFAANTVDDGFMEVTPLDATSAPENDGGPQDIGTMIGRYKLLERVGEGGMAVVYMAEQQHPVRRRVAVKVIKPGMDTESVIARFQAERQALALMDHPHIAKVFDGGTTDDRRPYFVMELVRGVPITEFCDQNRLSGLQRLELFILVCEAVQHAHQKGIIHRDIKPSNVLVALHDGRPVPKVIDFGIAKATQSRLTDKTVFTKFQCFIGTPAYMSPEQAHMDSMDIDTRTDVYALGALLYELLTGRTPFEPKELTSFEDCRETILKKDPARPSARLSTLAGSERTTVARHRCAEPSQLVRLLRSDLDWITMRCLEKERQRRYESASALAQDIRRYLDGDVVVARPPSTTYRLGKLIRRNKVAAAIFTVVVLASFVSAWQAVRATRAVWEQHRLTGEVELALELEGQQRRRAEREEEAASRRAYNSDMTLGQLALSANNYGRVVDLLNRNRPINGGRDLRQWEWRYFWNQVRSEATFSLPQQSDAIAGLALSRDLRLLVTTELVGRLKLWDLRNHATLMEYDEPGFNPRAFALSRDGLQLATILQENNQSTVKIWSVATRKVVDQFSRDGWVSAVAFTPDGEDLLLFGHDRSLDRWQVRDQRLVKVVDPISATQAAARFQGQAAFSPDCTRIAFLAGDRIHIMNVDGGAVVAELEGFEGGTWSLAFSPDGTQLAAGPWSAATSTDIKVFSLESGEELRRLVGHVSWVPALAFTSRGTELVSAGADQTIRIWNVKNGQQRALFHGHRSEIYRVTASSDGSLIVSGAKDGTVLAWNANQVPRLSRFDSLPVPVTQLAFMPESDSFLSVDTYGNSTLWDSETMQPIEVVTSLGQDVRKLLVSSDGSRVYATTLGGGIRLLDWPTRQVIATIENETGPTTELVGLINRDRSLVFRDADLTIRLVDSDTLVTGSSWKTTLNAAPFYNSAGLSGQTNVLAIGGVRAPLHLVDLANGQVDTAPSSHNWGASDIAFSPNGRQFATSSLEGTIRLWDTSTLEVINELRGHLIGVNAIVYSPDGQRLASASQGDEAVKLWDATTGQEVATLKGEGLISDGLAFSPDGNLLVGINAQGKAHIWRAPSLEHISAEESRGDQEESQR